MTANDHPSDVKEVYLGYANVHLYSVDKNN